MKTNTNLKIKHNQYQNIKNICQMCGFPVMNTTNPQATCCTLPDEISPCLRFRKKLSVKKHREKEMEEARQIEMGLLKQDVKMRECIGMLCIDKEPEDRLFPSIGKYNRQCESCINAKEGVLIKNLSRISIPAADLKFIRI